VIGVLSGLLGGVVDSALMRATDVFMALPYLILIAVVSAMLGTGLMVVVLLIGFLGWAESARVVRGMTLSLREHDFVTASRSMGGWVSWVVRRPLLWHVLPVLTVTASLTVAYAILAEAGLSYLGLGIAPPLFSWGSMLTDAQQVTILAER